MASAKTWLEMFLFTSFILIAIFCQVFGSTHRYPFQQDTNAASYKTASHEHSIQPELPKHRKRKSLQQSKNLLSGESKEKRKRREKTDREFHPRTHPNQANLPIYTEEVEDNEVYVSERMPISPNAVNPVNQMKMNDKSRNVPYYDCPLDFNWKEMKWNTQALIKPDPSDCSCYYYCSWGIHFKECCSWPLLWNDEDKCCDWYWKVICRTYDGWDDIKSNKVS